VAVLTRGYPTARVLVDGARVVLVGPPNSGKSTLFNGLIGRASTVVSPRPGTTRDWVSSTFELQGAPLTLIDTAGRHEGCDALEECAIESGKTVAGAADLLVVVVDGSAESSCGDAWLRSLSATDRGILQVINKMDQISPHSVTMGCSSPSLGNEPPIHVSARTGAGIEELVTKIAEKLELSTPVDRRPCLFTGRQRLCAEKLLSDRVRSPQDAAARLCCGLLGE
jgi:tRNA modification GTPase